MKILRIIARLNVGGPARHVVWLTKGLADEFDSVLVAGRLPEGEEDMAYVAEASGIKPVFIEQMSRELSANDLISLFKIYRLMRQEKPDLICTHTAKAGTVGRAAAFLYRWFTPGTLIGRPRKLAVTHTFHGHVFHSYYGSLKTKLFVLIEKTLARLATDRIIVISDQQLKEIQDEVGVGRRDQYAVVPLGIDLESFAPERAQKSEFRDQLGIADDALIVSFVGRLTEIKNVSMYLQSAAEYEKRMAGQVPVAHFVVVGDGHLRSSLDAEATKLGVKNIHFAGNRTDVENVYAGTDIVALTSLNEGTPLSIIEAMAGRKPVISTLVGGVKDLLGPVVETKGDFSVHERGVSVASGDINGFASGLIYLAKNEKLRDELAARGYDFITANYSKDRMVDDLRSLYRELLETVR